MWNKTFSDGVLKIWSPDRTEADDPNIIQPFNPEGGQPWSSEVQANEWADKTIYLIENPPVIEAPAPVEEEPIA